MAIGFLFSSSNGRLHSSFYTLFLDGSGSEYLTGGQTAMQPSAQKSRDWHGL